MKFRYTIVYVNDVVKATEFYEKAFGLTTRFIHESRTYAEMETGETVLAFADNAMMKANTGIEAGTGVKNCFELAFTTDDVAHALEAALSGGAREVKKPETKPWGQVVAYVQDPFGTIIELCTPMN